MAEAADPVASAIGAALGRAVRVTGRRALGGGSISGVQRLETDAGAFVVKSHPSPPPGFFAAEAAGLTALRESGTSLCVPAVVALSEQPQLLVLEDLGSGRPASGFDEALGRGLAELHRRGAERFGFDCQTFCGTTPQPNPWTERWVDFYRDARLAHQVDLARSAGHLSPSESRAAGRLLERLDSLIGEPAEGPALIHGDLWSGNLHVSSAGAPCLIDPSASFSHREAELGMMGLFGGFGPRVYAAYEESFPLEAGWRERNPLYQLYHLLNHLNLFGGGYRSQAMAIVSRFA